MEPTTQPPPWADAPQPVAPPPEPRGGPSGSLFLLLLLVLLPAGLLAQSRHRLGGLLATELLVFLLPSLLAARRSGAPPLEWLRLRPPPAQALALAPLLGLAGWVVGSALHLATRAAAPESLVERFDVAPVFSGPLAERIAVTAVAVLVAPLCEEVAFRGHLAAALHTRHRPAVAIAASAAGFALLHLDPLRGPALLLIGLIYGWMSWRAGSIWPAIVAHATNNAVSAAAFLGAG